MNALQRNKIIIRAHNEGETFVDLAQKYGLNVSNMSKCYYTFSDIVDKTYYDAVAQMDFSDQLGTKLVNALHKYERLHGIDLTLEEIRDMDREQFIIMRGVGVSVARAFDRLREALKNES